MKKYTLIYYQALTLLSNFLYYKKALSSIQVINSIDGNDCQQLQPSLPADYPLYFT